MPVRCSPRPYIFSSAASPANARRAWLEPARTPGTSGAEKTTAGAPTGGASSTVPSDTRVAVTAPVVASTVTAKLPCVRRSACHADDPGGGPGCRALSGGSSTAPPGAAICTRTLLLPHAESFVTS